MGWSSWLCLGRRPRPAEPSINHVKIQQETSQAAPKAEGEQEKNGTPTSEVANEHSYSKDAKGSTASTSCIEAIIVSEQQVGVGAGALKDGYILPPVRIAKTNGERPSPDGGSPRSLEPGSSTAAPQTHGAPSEGDAARTQHMAPCGGLATTVSAQHAAVGSPSGPRGSPRPTSGLAVPLLGSTGLIRAESGRLSRHLSTSCLTRSRSLACMLGVDDVAAGDLLSPAEVTSLPLQDFSLLGTAELDQVLGDVADGDTEQCNLLASSPTLPPAMRRKHWALEDYQLLKHLHHGYVSDVVEARCRLSGAHVALKVFSLPEMSPLYRVQLLREIRLHLGLRHPNIVPMYAAFIEQGTMPQSDEKGREVKRARYNHVVIVHEFADKGDLLRLIIKSGGKLPEQTAVNMVLRPLLSVLAYMHARGVVHRDIKPGNILFDRHGHLKLADFGLSIDLNEERANTRAGTLEFMAPEVLACPPKSHPNQNKEEPYSPAASPRPSVSNPAMMMQEYTTTADTWCVGVLLYAMLTGQPPFPSKNQRETAAKILSEDPASFIPELPTLSPLAQNFISLCMRAQPSDRPTIVELTEHQLLVHYRQTSSVAHVPGNLQPRSSAGTPSRASRPHSTNSTNTNNTLGHSPHWGSRGFPGSSPQTASHLSMQVVGNNSGRMSGGFATSLSMHQQPVIAGPRMSQASGPAVMSDVVHGRRSSHSQSHQGPHSARQVGSSAASSATIGLACELQAAPGSQQACRPQLVGSGNMSRHVSQLKGRDSTGSNTSNNMQSL